MIHSPDMENVYTGRCGPHKLPGWVAMCMFRWTWEVMGGKWVQEKHED